MSGTRTIPDAWGYFQARTIALLVLRLVQAEAQGAGKRRGVGPVGLDQGDRGLSGAGQALAGQFRDPAQDVLQVTLGQLDLTEPGDGQLRLQRNLGDGSPPARADRQESRQLSTRRSQGRILPAGGTAGSLRCGPGPAPQGSGAGSLPPRGGQLQASILSTPDRRDYPDSGPAARPPRHG